MTMSVIKDKKLKCTTIEIDVSQMVFSTYYYSYTIPQSHNYIFAELEGWNGAGTTVFTAFYSTHSKTVYALFGNTPPARLQFNFYYYD